MNIAIIGAGWAGLAAGIKLSAVGHKVTIYEAAQSAGGRARSVRNELGIVDNGQHLFVGAYRELFSLLEQIGLQSHAYFLRFPLHIRMQRLTQCCFNLQLANGNTTVQLLLAIIRSVGMNWPEKLQFIRASRSMLSATLEQDTSVAELFSKHKQPAVAIQMFWEPLCLGALNSGCEKSSAQVFLHMLKEVFNGPTGNADMLIAEADLGRVFPNPAIRYINQFHGSVLYGERVEQIITTQQGYCVQSKRGISEVYDHLIVATPPDASIKLLNANAELKPLLTMLQQLSSNPVCTVYLQYEHSVSLGDCPALGVQARYTQWLFDRRVCSQPGLIAAVISGDGQHMQLGKEELGVVVAAEISDLFPHWPQAKKIIVIREKRATFDCRPKINQFRPDNATALTGLWLAGDYTNTGLPATLESAVRSGVQCAQSIQKTLT